MSSATFAMYAAAAAASPPQQSSAPPLPALHHHLSQNPLSRMKRQLSVTWNRIVLNGKDRRPSSATAKNHGIHSSKNQPLKGIHESYSFYETTRQPDNNAQNNKRTSPAANLLLRTQQPQQKPVGKSASDYGIIARVAELDDEIAVTPDRDSYQYEPSAHTRTPSFKETKKSKMSGNSRTRSVSKLFAKSNTNEPKLRSSKSLFNFRFFGASDAHLTPVQLRVKSSKLLLLPHSQSQLFQSSASLSGDCSSVIPPKRFRPRPRSEIIYDPESTQVGWNRRRSFTPDLSTLSNSEAYVKLDQLGEGSYAIVYKGFNLRNHQIVALKEIKINPEEGTPFTAIREASLLKGLKHANIVTLTDIVHTKETLTFVFEFVPYNLGQHLDKHPGGIHPHNAKLFLLQLLRGLHFCHARKILHRDLKPQNLLISEMGELKLADFAGLGIQVQVDFESGSFLGLARAKSIPSRNYSNEVVTLWYRPPDVLLGSTDYSTPLDMWGVGCIFVEILTGLPAFPGAKETDDQLDQIFRVLGTINEEIWPQVSGLAGYQPMLLNRYPAVALHDAFPKIGPNNLTEELCCAFLQLNPDRRISAHDALRHPYFCDLPMTAIISLAPEESVFACPEVKAISESRSKK